MRSTKLVSPADAFSWIEDDGGLLAYAYLASTTNSLINRVLDHSGSKKIIGSIRASREDLWLYIERCRQWMNTPFNPNYSNPNDMRIAVYAILIAYTDPQTAGPLLREIAGMVPYGNRTAISAANELIKRTQDGL